MDIQIKLEENQLEVIKQQIKKELLKEFEAELTCRKPIATEIRNHFEQQMKLKCPEKFDHYQTQRIKNAVYEIVRAATGVNNISQVTDDQLEYAKNIINVLSKIVS